MSGSVYLDAGVLIRLVQTDHSAYLPIQVRLAKVNSKCTSVISRIECLALPTRNADRQLLEMFRGAFSAPDFEIVDVDDRIAKHATLIRARFNLKVPDAIHLATAEVAECSAFLTTDMDFKRCVGWSGCPIEFLPSI